MQTFIIRFPSITYAQKASRLLEQNGIRARLTRQGSRGCSYGLEIYATSPEDVKTFLEENGVIFTL
ncbi:MAG: DUF3343 domain-containing protein [Clostridia bacterium]|nr:DUF3343 domain-containing protein [Clostridia bacterium]